MEKFTFVNFAVVLALVLSLSGADNFSANDSSNSSGLQNRTNDLPNTTKDSFAAVENAANGSQNAEEAQKATPPESGWVLGPKSLNSGFETGRPDNGQLPADWLSGDFDAEGRDSSCFRCGNGVWGADAVKLEKDASMKSYLKFETIDTASYLKKIINNPRRGKYTFEFKVKITQPFTGCTSYECTNSFMFEVSGWWWQGDVWQAVNNWPIFFNENGAYLYGREPGLVEADVSFEDAGDGWKKIAVTIDTANMQDGVQKLGIYFGNGDAQEGSFLLDDFSMNVEGA